MIKHKKVFQKFAVYKKYTTFANAFREMHFTEVIAEIAQLVEHNLAKVGVASSSLVFRSLFLSLFLEKHTFNEFIFALFR